MGRRTGFGAKMMPMKLRNIAPITELKRDAAALIERASEQRSPIVITQNGRATAVLQDVESFEQDRRAFALLKLTLQGDADVAEGRVVSRAEYKKRLAALLKARGSRASEPCSPSGTSRGCAPPGEWFLSCDDASRLTP
jgi:prevent-host-death family protein